MGANKCATDILQVNISVIVDNDQFLDIEEENPMNVLYNLRKRLRSFPITGSGVELFQIKNGGIKLSLIRK